TSDRGVLVMRDPTKEYHLGLEYHVVPPEYSEHALAKGKLFFTLPEPFLAHLAKEIGRERFNAGLYEMELAMTRACGGEDGVGFWAGNRFKFPLLRYQ